jgi:hypothetical protein
VRAATNGAQLNDAWLAAGGVWVFTGCAGQLLSGEYHLAQGVISYRSGKWSYWHTAVCFSCRMNVSGCVSAEQPGANQLFMTAAALQSACAIAKSFPVSHVTAL